MRTPEYGQDRRFHVVAVLLMLFVVGFLGLRSRQVMNTVLNDDPGTTATSTAATRLVDEHLEGIADRDERVAEARLDADRRDPFSLSRSAPPPRRTTPPPKVQRLIQPHLAALIYDDVSPTVQIRISGVRSDWLRTGDHFKGWRVAEIGSDSVKVSKGGRDVVLR